MSEERVNVYLDCNRCDRDFIRQEVDYVNYVRDRQDADIHLFITTQNTGSGGTEYELNFIASGRYADTGTILRYSSSGTDSDDQRREGLKRTIEIGLMPALSLTPLGSSIRLSVDRPETRVVQAPLVDPWRNWVFRIGTDAEVQGESSQRSLELGGNFSATKTTDEWKVRLSFNGDYERREYDINDETRVYTSEEGAISGMVANSLGNHWSIGAFGEANTSSFENTNFSMEYSPAIEYNLYPYSESSRREFRFTYHLNIRYFEYADTTIFNKTQETRLHQSLGASYEIQQPWGSANFSVTGSHYLHDTSKYRVDVFARFEIQIVRGLSFDVFGRVSRRQDQLYISKEELDEGDIYLGFTDLATEWDYSVRTGISYRFGSIFNNVVNSRFGNGGGRDFF